MKVGDFAIRQHGHWLTVVKLTAVTAEQVRYMEGSRERRVSQTQILFASPDEDDVRRRVEQLKSAKAELERRERAAREWFSKRRAEILK